MKRWRGFRESLWFFLAFSCLVVSKGNEIPDELDPFLELLFETSECESVVANDKFLVVETRKCKPFICDFPFEACMRPSHLVSEEKANQCREIPDACLTAANGGIHIPKPAIPTSTFPPTPPSTRILGGMSETEHGRIDGDFEEAGNDGEEELETSTIQVSTRHPALRTKIRPNRLNKEAICEQGIPNGRFCGFQMKYTFNRETGDCEQFCRTEDTNDNLFDTDEACRAATIACTARSQSGQGHQKPYTRQIVQPPQPERPSGTGRGNPNFSGPDRNSQLKGFMEWAGSALGNTNGEAGRGIRPEEYGGGELGSGQGVTQPPNLIRFIANTIRDVGNAQKGGGNGNSAAVFTNILQQLLAS